MTNVFTYFDRLLGRKPSHEEFRACPITSNCGTDCRRAIDAAAALLAEADAAGTISERERLTVIAVAQTICETYWFG